MSDKVYIYGDNNGATMARGVPVSDEAPSSRQTFWDSRLEIQGFAHTVQVGIVPASEKSTDDGGIWDREDGQWMTLSRDGNTRAIMALREARDSIYGKDQ
jgi:hypothetical protein